VLTADDSGTNPRPAAGAALGGTVPLRDKLVFTDHGSGIDGLPAWAEQLIAESTGKDGTGLLPVVVADGDPETGWDAPDLLQVQLVGEDAPAAPAHGVQVSGSLGAQLLLWEVATAVAGRLLGINPFDQPDVEAAKTAARSLLD
ncbi:glucose-6-phosphate isomerase, partial [Micrococcus endophyticus]